jgi:hypothetical protein
MSVFCILGCERAVIPEPDSTPRVQTPAIRSAVVFVV